MTAICITCAHHTKTDTHRCGKHVDIVTGDSMQCSTARASDTLCGPDGKDHQPRQNLAATLDKAISYTAFNHMPPIETPMATIRGENDPTLMRKLGLDGKPRSDYTPE